jgi:DNA-binding CsgD family transcriptional regulator
LHLIPKGEQARILDKLSFEYYLTGQIETAIQVRHQAIDLWREGEQPKQVGDDQRWLSRLYWFFGNKAMADHYAQEAIAVLEPLQPGKELAMVYSNRSQLHMLSEDIEGTFDWGKKALDLAESLGETEIIIHALTNIDSAEMTNGGESGRIKLEQALRLAEANEMHDHAARCYAGLISRTVENWNYPAAERYLEAGLTYTTDRDMDSYSIYFRGWRARWFFEQGRWAEATTCVEEVLQLHPGSAVIALPAVTTLGHVEVRQGHSDAMRLLDQARELALGTSEFQRITPVSVARAEAAWWNDQPQRVLEEIQPAEALSNRTRGAYSLGAIAYWIWRAGGEVRWESEIPTAYRAMITGDWRNAADEWGRIGCPYEQALALAEGDLEAQRTALAIFDRLGARPARRWLREKMLSEGLKRVPRGVRASTRNNPEGLTDRELNILALLEQGLSNAEIAKQLTISPKTVDHHVSAILAKLQVHSRLEAAALARQKNIH